MMTAGTVTAGTCTADVNVYVTFTAADLGVAIAAAVAASVTDAAGTAGAAGVNS